MNSDLQALYEYPFARLRRLLEGLEPAASPIDCSVGEPRGPLPDFVAPVLNQALEGFGRYPSTAGDPNLRAAIAQWLTDRYNLSSGMIDPGRHIIPAFGTREALWSAALAVFDRQWGGEIGLPNPFYQIYEGGALMAGARPRYIPCGADGKMDWQSLGEEQWEQLQALYVCSPGNPTGAVLNEQEWRELIAACRRHGVVLLADECYSELYVDAPPVGVLQGCDGDLTGILTFNSLSKRSGLPGLRAGFVAGDPELIAGFLNLRTYTGVAQPLPLAAVAEAAWCDEGHVAHNRELLAQRVDAFVSHFPRAADGWSGAGMFVWLEVADGEAYARRAWGEQGVKVLPGIYLGRGQQGHNPGAGRVRIALVDDPDTLAEAGRRLNQMEKEGR
ncbi:MAG: hypothetical protein AUJ55_12770 [Proteobacteria bacterium CG1_02_64_396]|nr:MAG: hypothetical protein AUJ55_12770 [Proteobacteria bacterium CG1_02_64_396]